MANFLTKIGTPKRIGMAQQNQPPLSLFTAQSRLKATFVAPSKEGPYRLFATIYNHNGSYATCNTPFYVVGKP